MSERSNRNPARPTDDCDASSPLSETRDDEIVRKGTVDGDKRNPSGTDERAPPTGGGAR
jgi:hypothetical protein